MVEYFVGEVLPVLEISGTVVFTGRRVFVVLGCQEDGRTILQRFGHTPMYTTVVVRLGSTLWPIVSRCLPFFFVCTVATSGVPVFFSTRAYVIGEVGIFS